MYNIRGKRAGKRNNKGATPAQRHFNKSVEADARSLMPHISEAKVRLDKGQRFNECVHGSEEYVGPIPYGYEPGIGEVKILPREDISTTHKQFLRLFPSVPDEVIDLKGKRLDKLTGKMVEVTEPFVLSWTDRTLLRPGIPFPEAKLARQTSRSKRIEYNIDRDIPAPTRQRISETIQDVDLDSPPSKGRSQVSSKGVKLI